MEITTKDIVRIMKNFNKEIFFHFQSCRTVQIEICYNNSLDGNVYRGMGIVPIIFSEVSSISYLT